MAFLTKGKKEDLRKLAWEMGLSVGEDLRILDIKHLIVNSEKYEEASIKNLFTNIIEERLEKIKNDEQAAEQERKKAEQAEEEERKKAEQAADLERRKAEMDFELQKLKLQLEAKMSGVPQIKKTVNSKENSSKPYAPKRNSYDSRFDKTNQAGPTSSFNRGDKLKTDDRSDRPSVSCYGCGKPGVTKPRCPNCKPAVNKDSATFSNISLHSCSLTPNQSAVLKLAVNGIWGTACADSGASHSIAGETLYLLLQKEGANFQKTQITMSLADGHKSEVEVYTTSVVIRLEERVIRTQLIILPYAKGNRTLLGMDFLQKAGIVLNLKHRNWFFSDSPHRTYDFVKEAIIQEVQSKPNLEENTCLLRDDEGKCLTLDQKNELGTLLKKYTNPLLILLPAMPPWISQMKG
ncbi:transposon Ty3-I Gag-Pol polyprotein [Trichonephila clavata]|uniref:Transposon Ty3-I Gag-Pol polyprotein n=1 Tax=Trichonephila clavata TaxID=2740835 RepID=A0A8X6IKC9_TRICU|nr:transposon Ty3-I Gag-Pol polyprotein [Trichonephila clavata]